MPELLLVGAGHTHLHVLTRAGDLAAAGYRVRLLAPRWFHYSGVAAATAAGSLSAGAGRIDVGALAERCGVELVEGELVSLDPDRRVATDSAGGETSYDVLSLNVGSVVAPAGLEVHPAVLRVKPLSGLEDLDARLRSVSAPRGGSMVTVIGGGATGLELAAHLAVRDDVAGVRVLESGPHVGRDLPVGARRRIGRLLDRRRVDVRTGCAVADVGEHRTRCADGSEVSHDVALLATGLAAPPLLAQLGLGDERGVPVRATLQHVERAEVYAVGDCARFLPRPLPRIGVHGVRQGPVLVESLLARRNGGRLPEYEPQRRALSILDLGGGVGLAVRGRWWWYGASAVRLKRVIDRRWLQDYR